MARRPRFAFADFPLHVVQRGNDRRKCFFEDGDYRFYLRALAEAAVRYGVLVHAYVLMTNHVHLLLTPRAPGGVSRVMQSLGSRYVKHVNARAGRVGTLWESRYKACVVERDAHLLAVCRYIDLNPVRAGMVASPEDYGWSSYAALAGLRHDRIITPHSALEQLGSPRDAAYVTWCKRGIATEELDVLREATSRETVYGSEDFKAHISATMKGD
jgi:putative transposase